MAIQSPSQPDNFSYQAIEVPREVWPAGSRRAVALTVGIAVLLTSLALFLGSVF